VGKRLVKYYYGSMTSLFFMVVRHCVALSARDAGLKLPRCLPKQALRALNRATSVPYRCPSTIFTSLLAFPVSTALADESDNPPGTTVVRNVLALDDDPPLRKPLASHLYRGPAVLPVRWRHRP
jgi:hypothetical protein